VTTGSVKESSLKLAFVSRMRPDGSKVARPNLTETPVSARWSSIERRTNRGTWSSLTDAM
jgi:hypothetical protein